MRHRTPLVKFGLPDHPPDVAPIRKDKEAEKATTRKKGLGVRTWLAIDEKGETKIIEAGKHAIMHRTFLPARDLRILDPLLSYPSTILGREHAIVVNLEHIKAIITANEVLLLNSKDPLVTPFVHDLQKRLPVHYNALGQQVPADGGGATSDNEIGSAGGLKFSPGGLTTQDRSGNGNQAFVGDSSVMDHPLTKFQEPTHVKPGAPTVLPFEFRALESCLEAACSCLDAETNALEEQAYPALDELTSKISTLNLERVRQIKSRLVTISGRVQKVRDEIEQLLDDDGDMAEMYLTDKLMRQELDSPSSPAILAHVDEAINPEIASVSSDSDEDRPLLGAEERENQNVAADNLAETRYLENIPSLIRTDINNMSNRTSTTSSSSSSNRSKHLNVEELEMLLEAYFVQIEGTLNKLSTLKEYVDDTEDYINIMLDDKQNHLLQMAVMLTTATLVVSAFIVVTGLFGMNIHISLFDTGTMVDFLWVVGGTAIGAFFIYFGVIGWCKWKRLLE